MKVPLGILAAVGSAAVIVAALIASAVPQGDAVVRFGIVAAVVLAYAVLADSWTASCVVGLIAFLIFNGFLVNQLGTLSWHGHADFVRLMILGTFVIFGTLAGDIVQSVRRPGGGRIPAQPANGSMAWRTFIEEGKHDA